MIGEGWEAREILNMNNQVSEPSCYKVQRTTDPEHSRGEFQFL